MKKNQFTENVLEFLTQNQGKMALIFVGPTRNRLLVNALVPLHIKQAEMGWLVDVELYSAFLERTETADKKKIKNWEKKYVKGVFKNR